MYLLINTKVYLGEFIKQNIVSKEKYKNVIIVGYMQREKLLTIKYLIIKAMQNVRES
jgi:hypothetical protein